MWIIFTLFASISQLFRNLYSKKLVGSISPTGVSLSRFLYSLPIVVFLFLIFNKIHGSIVILEWKFYIWAFLMGVTQVLATFFRVSLFKYKNFAVSVTLVQIDTLFIAIIGALLLKEFLDFKSWIGVLSGTLGLIVASLTKNLVTPSDIKKALFSKATVIALLTGLFLSLAALFSKKATNIIDGPLTTRTLFTLMHILAFEIIILLPITLKFHKESLIGIIKRPIIPGLIGVFSGIGSFCWISAYSIAKIANVRVIGQSEFLLATLVTLLYFKERISVSEGIGMALVSLGALLIII